MARTNLFNNPRPFSAAGWSATQSGTTGAFVAAAGPISGLTGYFEVSRTTAGTRNVSATSPAPGKLGQPVTVSIYVFCTVATSIAGTVYLQNGSSQSVGGYFFIPTRAVPANTWTRIVVTSAATDYPGSLTPSDHTHVTVALQDQSTLSTTKLRAAAVMVGASGAYFDGDMPDVGELARWWDGAPYASSSTEAAPLTVTPDIEDATVTIVATVDPSTSPFTIFSNNLYDIYTNAGYYDWSGYYTIYRVGTNMYWETTAATGMVTRPLPPMIVGRTYRVSIDAVRGATAKTFGIVGLSPVGQIPAGRGSWTHTVEVVATSTTHLLFMGTVMKTSAQFSRISVELIPVGYVEGRFALTRTDASGTRPVRLLEGQGLSDGALVIEDAEASMVGPITYTLLTPAGEAVTRSTTLEGAEGYRLHPVPFPQLTETAGMVTGYDATRASGTSEHQVIGRPDPIVRLAPLRSRRGTLTLWCSSYEALRAMLAVYERGEIVMLRQPDYAGLDLYHVVLDAREGPYDDGGRRWRLDITYVEVGYPTGPLLGAIGWTWDDLVAAFPTWSAVVEAYATWTAAQIGPTT